MKRKELENKIEAIYKDLQTKDNWLAYERRYIQVSHSGFSRGYKTAYDIAVHVALSTFNTHDSMRGRDMRLKTVHINVAKIYDVFNFKAARRIGNTEKIKESLTNLVDRGIIEIKSVEFDLGIKTKELSLEEILDTDFVVYQALASHSEAEPSRIYFNCSLDAIYRICWSKLSDSSMIKHIAVYAAIVRRMNEPKKKYDLGSISPYDISNYSSMNYASNYVSFESIDGLAKHSILNKRTVMDSIDTLIALKALYVTQVLTDSSRFNEFQNFYARYEDRYLMHVYLQNRFQSSENDILDVREFSFDEDVVKANLKQRKKPKPRVKKAKKVEVVENDEVVETETEIKEDPRETLAENSEIKTLAEKTVEKEAKEIKKMMTVKKEVPQVDWEYLKSKETFHNLQSERVTKFLEELKDNGESEIDEMFDEVDYEATKKEKTEEDSQETEPQEESEQEQLKDEDKGMVINGVLTKSVSHEFNWDDICAEED